MTAIAALVDEDKTVWIGGDSAGVAGLSVEVRKDPKVFRNGSFLMGFTTSFRMGHILHYTFVPPACPEDMKTDMYMNTLFIDSVRACFNEYGYGTGRDKYGGTFVVGYRGRLFVVEDDFQVCMPYKNYTAVGCGHDLCKGSLHSTDGLEITPKDRIRKALAAAEEFSGGVRKPFIIESLKI